MLQATAMEESANSALPDKYYQSRYPMAKPNTNKKSKMDTMHTSTNTYRLTCVARNQATDLYRTDSSDGQFDIEDKPEQESLVLGHHKFDSKMIHIQSFHLSLLADRIICIHKLFLHDIISTTYAEWVQRNNRSTAAVGNSERGEIESVIDQHQDQRCRVEMNE